MDRLWAIVLLVVPAAAGCLQLVEDVEPTVQPGDFVVADLTRTVEDGQTTRSEATRLAVAGRLPRPEALPDGWTRNGTRTAVPGLVEAMDGMSAGETRSTGWLEPREAYGIRNPGWVDTFDRTARLPRTVDADVEQGEAEAYGRTWNATPANGSAYLNVTSDDLGRLVEAPRFWDDGTRLWRSRLVDLNASHLVVRHAVEAGATVRRGGVEGRVAAVNDTAVVVDRNHPLAGRRVRFDVTVREIVFTEPPRARAPGFTLTTIHGSRFDLDDHRGRPVVLYFFATWCAVCRTQTPRIVDLQDRVGANLTVLALSVDPNEQVEAVEEYEARYEGTSGPAGVAFAIAGARNRVANSYQVISIPKTALVAPDGTLAWEAVGAVPLDEMVDRVRSASGTPKA